MLLWLKRLIQRVLPGRAAPRHSTARAEPDRLDILFARLERETERVVAEEIERSRRLGVSL